MLKIGSRSQVMHSNARMTGGGLRKKDLKYNKYGKIVSKKMSQRAKKEKRLQKAGYTKVKGQFGAFKMKGGMVGKENSLSVQESASAQASSPESAPESAPTPAPESASAPASAPASASVSTPAPESASAPASAPAPESASVPASAPAPLYNNSESYIRRFDIKKINIDTKSYIRIIDLEYNKVYYSPEIIPEFIYGVYNKANNKIFFINDQAIILNNSNNSNKLKISNTLKIIIGNLHKIKGILVNKFSSRTLRIRLKKNKIYIIYISNELGCYTFKKNNIDDIIRNFNNKLYRICPKLELKFNNRENLHGNISRAGSNTPDGLLLCLYKNNNCISSIELKYKGNGEMHIVPETLIKNEDNKHKLLISVIIIVSSLIICHENKINKIVLDATDSITAWLLIGYFNTTYKSANNKMNEYIKSINKINENILYNLYTRNEDNNLIITVELNPENINRANTIFNNLIENNRDNELIKCN